MDAAGWVNIQLWNCGDNTQHGCMHMVSAFEREVKVLNVCGNSYVKKPYIQTGWYIIIGHIYMQSTDSGICVKKIDHTEWYPEVILIFYPVKTNRRGQGYLYGNESPKNTYLMLLSCPQIPQRHTFPLHLTAEGSTAPLIARFMGPTSGPSGADRTQVSPMLAPWNLLSGAFTCMNQSIW